MTLKRNVFNALIVVFIIIFFELVLRLLFSIRTLDKIINVQDSYFWKRSWIERIYKKNKKLTYEFDVHDTTKGWMTEPNLVKKKVFGSRWLSTNSRGFRETKEYSNSEKKSINILIIGDSFTFGDEVSNDETYPYLLQQMIPEANIFNLGIHGYGHDQMLILLKEELHHVKPDFIILGYLHQDIERNSLDFKDFAKPIFKLSNNKLILQQRSIPHPEDVLNNDWKRPRIIDFYSLIKNKILFKTGATENYRNKITFEILKEISIVTNRAGAKSIYIFLPNGKEITTKTDIYEERLFNQFCNAINKVRCITARPAFIKKIKQGQKFKYGHWDYPGHLTTAEVLFEELSSEIK